MPNSPKPNTPAADELDKLLNAIKIAPGRIDSNAATYKQYKAAILAYCNERVREARIDENKHLLMTYWQENERSGYIECDDIDERIAQLTANQEGDL